MPRRLTAHLPVGGALQLPAAVAAHGITHPGKMFQVVLHAPETATGKDRRLQLSHGALGPAEQHQAGEQQQKGSFHPIT